MDRLTIDEARARIVDQLSDAFQVETMPGDFDNRIAVRLQPHEDPERSIDLELINAQFVDPEWLQACIEEMKGVA